jgi:hypothetical protein
MIASAEGTGGRGLAVVCAVLWWAVGTLPAAAQSGAGLAGALREAGVDAAECYRVRNLNFAREDLKFYLGDGYLAFSRPVAGRRVTAVFTTGAEDGDAETILMPPNRSERRSLASFIGSPNLDEHFHSAFFVLGSELAAQLLTRARTSEACDSEARAKLETEWTPVIQNVSGSFAMRLVEELLAPGPDELFVAALRGGRLGVFELVYDPRAREQILAGRFTSGEQPTFEVWTSFEARPVRKGLRKLPPRPFAMSDFRIDATLGADLGLTCTTRARITPAASGIRALAFHISDRMRVTEARLDGQPIEVFARESPRESALRGSGSATFLAIAPAPLAAGRSYEIEFRHAGNVVENAGNGVFYVAARDTWYPNVAAAFAGYDLTFRYPANLTLVSTGAPVEDRREGDQRVQRRRTDAPIRMAGFNLGEYRRTTVTRDGYTVEVYGNRMVEDSLRPRPPLPMVVVPPFPVGGRNPPASITLSLPPAPDPAAELARLAEDVAGAMAYMAGLFGPPPVKTLTVAPIPGAFGQGFPGLIYLSTLSYLRPEERPAATRTLTLRTFFSDILAAHETAHQWWGNLVTSESTEDDWLMEALANYSALLYIEKRRGARALEPILDEYRRDLVERTAEGTTVESAGPVTWGARLTHTRAADAWRTITYEKGAWILHMLRRRMGDERFFKMLAELCRRYRFRALTTGDFRGLAQEFMPRGWEADDFFENWIYGTGIPTLKLAFSVRGAAPARVSGTIAQSGVDPGFSCEAPIEFHFAKGPPTTRWVRTAGDSVSFSFTLPRAPARVVLPAGTAILANPR